MKKEDTTKFYYVYLFYDVRKDRLDKVFKICKKYLNHYQNSVFRGEINPSDILKLKKEIQDIITVDDNVTLLKFLKKEYVKIEELSEKSNDDIFL